MTRIRIAAIIVCTLICAACGSAVQRLPPMQPEVVAASDDSLIGRAFRSRMSGVQVEGEGGVTRILADDQDGSRHQRFIIRLASGQTLLIVHNIDIAPRVSRLKEGDSVRFYGEYVWNEKGGLVHWTHHDPKGKHTAGWVRHNGRIYQ